MSYGYGAIFRRTRSSRGRNSTSTWKLKDSSMPFACPPMMHYCGTSKLIKIGAKVVRHSRQVVFQMAEVAVPRALFGSILQAIGRLKLPALASG